MTHAVLIQVRIDPDADAVHRHSVLHDIVIPEAKALRGFRKGTWMNDGRGTGTCVVFFDSEDNARSALGTLTPAGGPPVISCAVCAVEIDV
ncbi:MAG: hypothetical protein ACRDY1_16285 [Acidimicrobiales bacterium]